MACKKTRNFAEVHIQANSVVGYLLLEKGCKGDYEDRLAVVPELYQWRVKTRLNINSVEDIEYAMDIIKESYEMTS